MPAPILGAAAVKFVASPWGRTIIGTGAGILGGLFGGLAMGGGKKQAQSQEAALTTSTRTYTSTYSPSYQYDFSRMNIADSPGASMKKSTTQTPATTITPQVAITPTLDQAQKQAAGTDLTTIALIGGAAVIAHGYLSKK